MRLLSCDLNHGMALLGLFQLLPFSCRVFLLHCALPCPYKHQSLHKCSLIKGPGGERESGKVNWKVQYKGPALLQAYNHWKPEMNVTCCRSPQTKEKHWKCSEQQCFVLLQHSSAILRQGTLFPHRSELLACWIPGSVLYLMTFVNDKNKRLTASSHTWSNGRLCLSLSLEKPQEIF